MLPGVHSTAHSVTTLRTVRRTPRGRTGRANGNTDENTASATTPAHHRATDPPPRTRRPARTAPITTDGQIPAPAAGPTTRQTSSTTADSSRPNHPQMSPLPVRMGGTLGAAGPVRADQHAPCPV